MEGRVKYEIEIGHQGALYYMIFKNQELPRLSQGQAKGYGRITDFLPSLKVGHDFQKTTHNSPIYDECQT